MANKPALSKDPFSSLASFSKPTTNTSIGQLAAGLTKAQSKEHTLAQTLSTTTPALPITNWDLEFLALGGISKPSANQPSFDLGGGSIKAAEKKSQNSAKPGSKLASLENNRQCRNASIHGDNVASCVVQESSLKNMDFPSSDLQNTRPVPFTGQSALPTDDLLGLHSSNIPAQMLFANDFDLLGIVPDNSSFSQRHCYTDNNAIPIANHDILGFGVPDINAASKIDDHPLGILALPAQRQSMPHSENERAELQFLRTDLDILINMGFNRERSVLALESSNYNMEISIAILVSQPSTENPIEHVISSTQYRAPARPSKRSPSVSSARSSGRRVSFESGTMRKSYIASKPTEDVPGKLINTAASIATSMLSNAKSMFQFSKQKLSSLTNEKGAEDRSSSQNTVPQKQRYFDSSDSDSEEEMPRGLHTDSSISKSPVKLQRRPDLAPFAECQVATGKVTLPSLLISHRQEQRIASFKALGNDSYKQGDYPSSEIHYTTAIQTLQNIQSDLASYSHPIINKLYLNRAQTRLKTGMYGGAVEDSSLVIDQYGKGGCGAEEYKKALVKRAEAYESLEKYSDALEDHRKLTALGVVGSNGASRCLKAIQGTNAAASPPPATSDFLLDANAPVVSVKRLLYISLPSYSAPLQRIDPSVKIAVDKAVQIAVTALRNQNQANDELDTLKLSLKDGIDEKGKEANVRALLSSLETVLWPALEWKKIGLGELIQPNQVKIRYMRAVAKLHPDKLSRSTGVEEGMIAAAVFSALNEAWEAFKLQT